MENWLFLLLPLQLDTNNLLLRHSPHTHTHLHVRNDPTIAPAIENEVIYILQFSLNRVHLMNQPSIFATKAKRMHQTSDFFVSKWKRKHVLSFSLRVKKEIRLKLTRSLPSHRITSPASWRFSILKRRFISQQRRSVKSKPRMTTDLVKSKHFWAIKLLFSVQIINRRPRLVRKKERSN